MSSKNFKVMEMIGKGSFASVYKVLRKTDGKIYAMKRVKINKMSRKEISDALNEVRFLASIRHTNIVGFYEAFIENNDTELCIIMEFCGCGDLSQKVERYKKKRQYINEAKIWGYLIQALRSLVILHSNGICHRDLKTANTFLSEDGSIKIGDMNVSKQIKQGQLQTQIGTPYYMAPEIWNNKAYDERCDIWSLGCMIYEVSALRPPFLGDSFASLKRSVVSGRFPALPKVYSESLQRVIALMLRVNGRERPTAAQLLALPEIATKVEIMDSHHAPPNGDINHALMSTIKIPQVLKKLNEALPKPCYPEMRKNNERKSNDENSMNGVRPPVPPPTIDDAPHERKYNKIPSVPPSMPPSVPPSLPSSLMQHHQHQYHHLQSNPPIPTAPRGARRPIPNAIPRSYHNRVW